MATLPQKENLSKGGWKWAEKLELADSRRSLGPPTWELKIGGICSHKRALYIYIANFFIPKSRSLHPPLAHAGQGRRGPRRPNTSSRPRRHHHHQLSPTIIGSNRPWRMAVGGGGDAGHWILGECLKGQALHPIHKTFTAHCIKGSYSCMRV